jgi:hypothetical protein
MNIQHELPIDRIHLLTFDTLKELASTFLRFQEHYESPEFRGKIFSLDEYKKWYIANSERGQKIGKFTYYSDWAGFNVPSYVFSPFNEGKFDPLSRKEKQLLGILKNEPEPFYTIGIFRQDKSPDHLQHELAHGLFYTNKEYRETITDILQDFDLTKMKDKLRSIGGYHEDVLDDECHAYSISIDAAKKYLSEKMISRIKDAYAERTRNIKLA